MKENRIIETQVERIVIPPDSRERILTQPSPNIHCMDDYNILIAGISELTKGYSAERFPSYYNMILYVYSGSAQVEENGTTQRLNAGEVMTAPIGHTFSYAPLTDHWEIAWIHLVDSPNWNPLFFDTITIRPAQWGQLVKNLMETFITESNTRRADSRQPLRLCTEMISCYLKRELGMENATELKARETLQNLWSQAHADLPRKWTIDELAASAGLCKTYLHRLCTKFYNKSPMNMITTMRMERAAELLSYSNYTLEMIAGEVGYESAFTFSKAFKRYAGISPKEFRQKQSAT